MSKCIEYLNQDTMQDKLFNELKEDITNLVQKEGVSSGCNIYCSDVGEITISISNQFSSTLVEELNNYTELHAKISFSKGNSSVLLIYNVSEYLNNQIWESVINE